MKVLRYFVSSINTVLVGKCCSRSNAPRHMWKQHQVFLPSLALLSSCLSWLSSEGLFPALCWCIGHDYISKGQDEEQGAIILLCAAKTMVFLFPILPEVSWRFWKISKKATSVSSNHCKVHRKRSCTLKTRKKPGRPCLRTPANDKGDS